MNHQEAALEEIPHICKKVCLTWGTRDVESYISSLLLDSRDGERHGLPMSVASELLWLTEFNKNQRAFDLAKKLKADPNQALSILESQDALTTISADVWGNRPYVIGNALDRRHHDKPPQSRPRRRREENTLFGIVFGFVTNKYVLLSIVAILTFRAMWPYIKLFL